MNDLKTAAHWVEFLADCPEIPFRSRLLEHLAAGQITRLCDCGCNSFDLEIPAGVVLRPLCPPSDGGSRMFFEIAFESSDGRGVDCLFFADSRGYLQGIDVTHGESNEGPLPADLRLGPVRYVFTDHSVS